MTGSQPDQAALVAHVITISQGVAFHGPVWKWSCACGAGESGYIKELYAKAEGRQHAHEQAASDV